MFPAECQRDNTGESSYGPTSGYEALRTEHASNRLSAPLRSNS